MVVLIAGCGYNWLQVRLLQAEVGDLKARAARQNRSPPTRLGSPGADWPVTEQELRRGANGLKMRWTAPGRRSRAEPCTLCKHKPSSFGSRPTPFGARLIPLPAVTHLDCSAVWEAA